MIKQTDNYSEEFLDETESLTIGNEYAGMRLDAALAALLPDFSRAQITAQIKAEQVWVDGKIAAPKTKLIGGELIHLHLPQAQEAHSFNAENIPLDIIFEDSSIIVINKPANLVVHPAAGNWTGTLLNGLLHHCSDLRNIPRAGIVHRLDKDTSGLMVVAKTLAAQTHLVRQLQARRVKRLYRAIADGLIFRDQTIEANIGRNPHNRLKMAVLSFGGKEAITQIRILERFAAHTLIECALQTGRTHQIRVHLREYGHPLAGDPLYGNARHECSDMVRDAVRLLNRQALHAWKLSFLHPESGDEVSFQIPLPDDMKQLLRTLRQDIPQEDDWNDWDDYEVEVIEVRE